MQLTRHIVRQRRPRASWVLLLSAVLLAFQALHAQPGNENAEFKLAVNLYNDAMYDLAAEQLKNFIAAYPGTAQGIEARFYLGQTQMKLKRYDDARVTFQNFALSYVEHPKAPDAWLNVGEAFHALGNDREAASAYERVKVFHPKSDAAPDALLRAAQLYRTAGERESARKALRSILQDYPSSKSVLPARLMIGELYAEEGQTDLALREARRVSESDAPASVRASALFSIGTIQSSVSLLDDAERTFRSIPTLYPGTSVVPLSLLELGILEARAGRHAQAAEHFRSVAGNDKLDDSTRAEAALRLGITLAAARDIPGALKAFSQSAAAAKGSATAARALLCASDVAARAGQWDKSLASAKEALALPPSPVARRAFAFAARAASALRRFDEAAQFYRSFLAAFPGDAFADAVLYRLGRLNQENRNDYRSAIAAYDQLLQEHPQSAFAAEAAFATADAQLAVGDADGALKTYLDIGKRYPASPRTSDLDSLMDAARQRSAGRRDEALRKLTRLIGEVLLEQSKPELAFQLGLIYLNDLGDAPAAADQFGAAIAAGLTGDHRADAYYFRARAAGAEASADSTARPRAIGYYSEYLKEFPSGARAEEAFFERTLLAAASARGAERMSAFQEFLTRYPSSAHAGRVQVALGSTLLAASQPAQALPPLLAAASRTGSPAERNEALALAGRAYEAIGRADSALAVRQQIADAPYRDRHTVDALLDLARARMDRRAYGAALQLLARVHTEFFYTPASSEAERLLAECTLQAGDASDAVAQYRALVERDTNSPFDLEDNSALLVFLAAAEEKKGDRQDAAATYHKAVAATNDASVTSKALYALGSLTQAAGNKERASAYFKQAAALGGTGSASPEIAELLFQTEQYAEAAKQFTQLAAGADSARAKREYRAKAIIATLRMDKLPEAQAMAAEFEKSFGKQKAAQADFAYERGLSYYRKQDYASARKAFNDVADDYADTPRGPWGEYYLGKIFEVSGALDQAAKAYTKILEKHPDSDVAPRVHLSLGNMHFNAERFEDAIRHYQAITAQPELAADVLSYAMNNLIEAYESTKLYDNALRTARDYIERYPNDENIIDKKIKIGTLYTKTGYYDQAVLHFQGILDEAGSLLEAEIRYDIGEAYYYKGDYQQAILEFLKVPYLVAKQGKVDWTATSFYMAGQSYEKMSRFDDALGMYQQIVDRPGIDATFKTAARKEIDRVKLLTKKGSK